MKDETVPPDLVAVEPVEEGEAEKALVEVPRLGDRRAHAAKGDPADGHLLETHRGDPRHPARGHHRQAEVEGGRFEAGPQGVRRVSTTQ